MRSPQLISNGKIEAASFSRCGFGPDPAPMQLDDLLAMRQTDAGAFVFAAGMQSLEDNKDPVQELPVNTNAVVLHEELPMPIVSYRPDIDGGAPVRFAKFDGIAEQVL